MFFQTLEGLVATKDSKERGPDGQPLSHERVKEALGESPELLSPPMGGSPFFSYVKAVTPTESRVIQASDNYPQMMGIPGRDVVGKTMADLFPADLAGKVTADDWAVASGGKVLELEEEFNGRTYTSIKFPIIQVGESLLAGYSFDITERKQTEESLLRTQFSVDHTEDLVLWVNPEGRFLYANEASCRRLGLSREELLGMTIYDIDPGTPQPWSTRFEEIRERGSFTFESSHRAKDGEIFPVELTVTHVNHGGQEYTAASARDISARKRAERELQITSRAIEQAGIGAMRLDREGRILEVNGYLCRLLGYSREELLRMTVFDVTVDLEASAWSGRWEGLKELGPTTSEQAYRTKSGEVVPVESSASIVEFDGQEFDHILVHDISDRKKAEGSLRQSEARFRGIFEQGSVGIALLDPNGSFLRANSNFCKMLGYKEDDLIGKSIAEVTAREDVQSSLEDTRALYSGKLSVLTMDKRYLRKDGELVWGQVSASLLRDKDANPVGSVAMVQDITERRRAEEALRESEAKIRSILDNIKVGVAVISPQMEILEMNPRMREWFPAIDPDQQSICYRAFNNPPREAVCDYCPTCKTLRDGLVHEATILTPSAGVVRNYRVVSSPIFDATGEVTAAIEMVEDVTERLALEQQLQQSQKMEAVGQLAGGMAHDFNNLLTSVLGYSELLLSDPEFATTAWHDDVVEIRAAGQRAAALTRQILAFSRRQALRLDVVLLSEVVTGMESLLRRTLGENIDLVSLQHPDLGHTEIDVHQFEQVLLNLAINARDAMPAGGRLTLETANVELDEEYCSTHPEVTPGDYVMLAVSDTGIGMDEATLGHAFEPFFTTKAPGEGTGLGLATVYGIVKQSRGNIFVYSEPSNGTTFKTYLPRVAIRETAQVVVLREQVSSLGDEIVMVVEDESSLRSLIERVLGAAGYTVICFGSADEAMVALQQGQEGIDLLLTDVVLPGVMQGNDLARSIQRSRPQLPVLFMSGYTRNAIVHAGRLDEGINFLEKPFTPEALSRTVRQVLDQAGAAG